MFDQKHVKIGTLLNAFFSLFLTNKFPVLVNSRKKPFPSNSETRQDAGLSKMGQLDQAL